MDVTPASGASSGKSWTGLKKAIAAVLGAGTIGSGVAGYLHLDSQIDDLASQNTALRQRLSANDIDREDLKGDLGVANATIARLQTDIANSAKATEANAGAIVTVQEDVRNQGTQIVGLQTQSTRQGVLLDGLGKEIKTATVKIGSLENEVSVSDLQDVYTQASASAVLLKVDAKYKVKEKNDKGVEVEVEKTLSQSGSGYMVAHIGTDGKKGAYIGTNWHVLQDDRLQEADYKNIEVTVFLPNGKTVKAKPHYYQDRTGKEHMARKKEHDVALLKTTEDVSGTKPVEFASTDPKAGEAVMVLGGPFASDIGYNFNASFGIVGGNSSVDYSGSDPHIRMHPGRNTISTARTDAAVNPGNSGGLGWRVKDGKMIFMPTFIFPGQIFHGMGFGVTAPTISGDIKDWIPYELNVDGRFIEKKPVVAPKPPAQKIKPATNKQSKIWDRSRTPLMSRVTLRRHNGEMRRYSKSVT